MASTRALPTKVCATCGHTFTWRKSWDKNWNDVRYCSKRCRGERPDDVDRALERAITNLLSQQRRDGTICPSEAARLVDPEGWRDLMEGARRAGRRLEAAGEVIVTQGGRRADPGAKGPIRFARSRSRG